MLGETSAHSVQPVSRFQKVTQPAETAFWYQAEATSFLTEMNAKYPEASTSRWIYVVYLLALNSALRAGKIWGLQVMDVTPDGRSIWVRRQFNRATLSFTVTKGKKARFVPCLPELLREIQSLVNGARLKSNETIFRNGDGKPVCHDNFADRQFMKDVKSWGGRRIRWSFHLNPLRFHKNAVRFRKRQCTHRIIFDSLMRNSNKLFRPFERGWICTSRILNRARRGK